MMIALAESLLECDGIDEDHLAHAVLAAYDPQRGYGSGTRAVLALIRDGVAPAEAAVRAFDGRGSLGNGAATVQVVAIGAALRRRRLSERCPCGGLDTGTAPRYCRSRGPAGRASGARGPLPLLSAQALPDTDPFPAAIYATAAHASFADAVSFAVRLGGDTDTIGAMTGAIAGGRAGAEAIPARWLAALEDGETGRTHVGSLADQLVP